MLTYWIEFFWFFLPISFWKNQYQSWYSQNGLEEPSRSLFWSHRIQEVGAVLKNCSIESFHFETLQCLYSLLLMKKSRKDSTYLVWSPGSICNFLMFEFGLPDPKFCFLRKLHDWNKHLPVQDLSTGLGM